MNINPSPKQQQDFMMMPNVEPVYMVNLLKFKRDGFEKYQSYIKEVEPLLKEVGAQLVWSGKPLTVLIGPEDETLWDAMIIMSYPGKMSLAQLGGHPNYPGHLREAALEDSRLIACSAFPIDQ